MYVSIFVVLHVRFDPAGNRIIKPLLYRRRISAIAGLGIIPTHDGIDGDEWICALVIANAGLRNNPAGIADRGIGWQT